MCSFTLNRKIMELIKLLKNITGGLLMVKNPNTSFVIKTCRYMYYLQNGVDNGLPKDFMGYQHFSPGSPAGYHVLLPYFYPWSYLWLSDVYQLSADCLLMCHVCIYRLIVWCIICVLADCLMYHVCIGWLSDVSCVYRPIVWHHILTSIMSCVYQLISWHISCMYVLGGV